MHSTPPKNRKPPNSPQHTLPLIYSNVLPFFFGVFECVVCYLPCNGFAYCCVKCGYYVDITCGCIPKEITRKSHPNNLLSLVQKHSSCYVCRRFHHFKRYGLQGIFYEKTLFFGCNICDIYIHLECALLLAETIRHKYDKHHPMKLSYLPI